MKTHIVQQTNISYIIISVNMLGFKLQGIVWDLSMMRQSLSAVKNQSEIAACEQITSEKANFVQTLFAHSNQSE